MKLTAPIILSACVLLSSRGHAGTVTATRVTADEVLTKEIGMRPSKASEELYYSFSANNATAVTDDSGNGYEGVSGGGSSWAQGGPFVGGCFSFNGSDGYMNIGPSLDFPSWASYSVSLWILHNGGGDFGPGYGHKMLDKTTWYHDWHLSLYPSTGGIGLSMYENGVGGGIGCSTVNLMDSTWHHVVVTRNGIKGEFWLDGVRVATCDTMFPVYSVANLVVGNSFSGDYYQRKSWSGKLDEIRIFDRAVTSNEVAQLFSQGTLAVTNQPTAVLVSTNLAVCGSLSVTGKASFVSGVVYSRPLGDLSCGSYTNTPDN